MSKKRFLFLFGISLLSLNIMMGQTTNAELEARAKQGDVQAMLDLAQNTVNSNEKEAVKWYEKAAKTGNTDAMMKLAELYRYSDEKKSMKWYENAAKTGNIDAMMTLADFYRKTKKDKAMKWLREAADAGNIEAKYQYFDNKITTYKRNGDETFLSFANMDYLTSAAEAGHGGAQLLLGRIYSLGLGRLDWDGSFVERIRPNRSEALKWLTKAAENPEYTDIVTKEIFDGSKGYNFNDYEKRKFRLLLIKNGKVPYESLSREEMREILEVMAFAQGIDKSILNANVYAADDMQYDIDRNRYYSNTNDTTFIALVENIRNNPAQRDKLLELYESGFSGKNKADYYTLAANILLSKKPTEEDSKRIYDYANKAYQTNNNKGLFLIGLCHLGGIGTPKNKEEGIEWMTKAKLKGSPLADRILISMGYDRRNLGNNLVYVMEDNKEGLYNSALDKYVVPLGKYGIGKSLCCNVARVYQDDCVGAVNDKGDLVIPIKYYELKDIQDGAFIKAITKSGEQAAYTTDGKLLAAPGKYTSIGYMSGGDITVYNGKKVGLIDGASGKLIVPCKYEQYFCYSKANGRMIFTDGNTMYIFNPNGSLVKTINGNNMNEYRLLSIYRQYMGTQYVTYTKEVNNAW